MERVGLESREIRLNSRDGVVGALGGSIALRRLHLGLLLLLLRRLLLLLLLSASALLHRLRRSREDVARAVRRSVGVTTTRRSGLLRSLVVVARVRSLTLLLLAATTHAHNTKTESQKHVSRARFTRNCCCVCA